MRIFKKAAAFVLTAVMTLHGSSAFVFGAETGSTAVEKEIQILQTSDIHGMFMPYTYVTLSDHPGGSLAQIATVIKERKNDHTITIDVGDTIQGNSASFFNDANPHPMMAGLNEIGYDYWVAGNHEFNYGVPTLQRIAGQFNGTFMCGNVFENGKPLGAVYDIKEIDGVKVATIGMVTPCITKWDADKLSSVTVTNPMDELKSVLNEIKDKADVIVFAYHAHNEWEFDVKGSNVYDIANAFPEIDVILAAHGHVPLNEEANGVLITENDDEGVTIADIDITVEPDPAGGYKVKNKTAELIPLKGVEPDPDLVEALSSYDEEARDDALTPVATLTGGDLVPPAEITGITPSLIQETSMLYMINSAQRYYADADVSAAAVLKRSSNIYEGPIRKCDIASIYPFDNTLYKLEMTGKQLKTYMEWCANFYNTFQKNDLTISFNPDIKSYIYGIFLGVNYEINISNPPGKRIENLTLEDGRELKDDDTITFAVSNYMATTQLLEYGSVYFSEKGDTLPKLLEKNMIAGAYIRDLIALWFTDDHYHGNVTPDRAYNWKITGYKWDEQLHQKAAELVNAGVVELPEWNDGPVTVDDIRASVSLKSMKKKVRVSIEPPKGADHFIVRYATNKKMKKAKTVTTTEPEVTLKKLKSGNPCYVEVTAVASRDGAPDISFAPSKIQKAKVK